MKKKEMWEILDKYSLPLGFAGWKTIIIKDKNNEQVDKNDYASIGVFLYTKKLEMYLSPIFYKECCESQKNILIHELMHARVKLKQLKIYQVEQQEEELMVNDIVNCVEEAMRR